MSKKDFQIVVGTESDGEIPEEIIEKMTKCGTRSGEEETHEDVMEKLLTSDANLTDRTPDEDERDEQIMSGNWNW